MGFTQKEVLEGLEESGRTNWNLRQMTALRKEGYLPPLRRETQPGTNKPLYVWDETDIQQIADAYDWWSYYDGDRATLALALWLKGYEIPLDVLRHTYITIIEVYIQMLTRGKTDPDDIFDEVSKVVVVWMRKMKYTPGLTDQRKKMRTEQNVSLEQIELLVETVLSALAVPDQEVANENIYSSLLGARESQDASIDYTEDDFFIRAEDVAAIMRNILALPHLHEAIITASPEQWQQARKDYSSFCHILSVIADRMPGKGEESFPEGFLMNMKIKGAVSLIAPLLSTRFRGYGQEIDIAFEKIYEFLADPIIQERILNKHLARRTIEADVEAKKSLN